MLKHTILTATKFARPLEWFYIRWMAAKSQSTLSEETDTGISCCHPSIGLAGDGKIQTRDVWFMLESFSTNMPSSQDGFNDKGGDSEL